MKSKIDLVLKKTVAALICFIKKIQIILTSPTLSFSIPFWFGPLKNLQNLALMPGDLGDARLNNYILEATFCFVRNKIPSLYNLPFFYPFPFMLGFTENMLGSSPFYIIFRFFGLSIETSYQLWYLLSFPLNFGAAYCCLRFLKCSKLEANLGALIFTFALPVYARTGHTQFAYRFCIPFVLTHLILFFKTKKLNHLIITYFWFSWLLWCSIYLAFYIFIFIVFILCAKIIILNNSNIPITRKLLTEINLLLIQTHKNINTIFVKCLILSIINILIIYPYWQCVHIYKISRSSVEILSYLPRISSYLFTDKSIVGNVLQRFGNNLPMRHEHQMFFGLFVSILFLLTAFFLLSKKTDQIYTIFLITLLFTVVSTLCFHNRSLWLLVCKLPFVSGIRVLTRFDLAMLFPLAYICSKNITAIAKYTNTQSSLTVVCFLLICLESSFSLPQMSTKSLWVSRANAAINRLQSVKTRDSVLLFSNNPPFFDDEIDSMFAGLLLGCPVVNGYSGSIIPGANADFRCGQLNELPRRISLYKQYVERNQHSCNENRNIIDHITPVGFEMNTDDYTKYLSTIKPSKVSVSEKSYPTEISSKIKLSILGKKTVAFSEWIFIFLNIMNENDFPLSCVSGSNTPLRLSWRFTQIKNHTVCGWDTRAELPFDLRIGNSTVIIPVRQQDIIDEGILEVTLVQESLFWLHDFGFKPACVKWKEIQESLNELQASGETL